MRIIRLHAVRSLAPLWFPPTESETTLFPSTPGVSAEEADFFRTNGYLVKEAGLDTDLLERAVELTWTQFPSRFDRNDSRTWTGKVEDCLCERTVAARKGRLKYRERVRRENWLYEMIADNACIRSVIDGILGAPRVVPPSRIRGIYPVLPSGTGWWKRSRPHTDGHPFLLGTMTYLSDVGPGGGGFQVWPGSHLVMRLAFTFAAGSDWTSDYHRQLYAMALKTPSREIVAPRGSVIFWHHRLAHAAGINRSRAIRFALLADYSVADFDDLKLSPVAKNPWSGWAISGQ